MDQSFKGFIGEKQPGVIDTEKFFRASFADAKSQFMPMRMDVKIHNLSLEELQKKNAGLPYLSFVDYIKENKNLVLSPQIAEKFRLMIIMHDDLIHRIKNFKNSDELESILDDVDVYIKENF